MDTQSIIAEAKARFAHHSAKHYLKEKFSNKNLVAEQDGLWRADVVTISALNAFTTDEVILLDIYENPRKVNRKQLLEKLVGVYEANMAEWYEEYKKLEPLK